MILLNVCYEILFAVGDSYSQMRSRLNLSLTLLGYDRLSETDSILYIYIYIEM